MSTNECSQHFNCLLFVVKHWLRCNFTCNWFMQCKWTNWTNNFNHIFIVNRSFGECFVWCYESLSNCQLQNRNHYIRFIQVWREMETHFWRILRAKWESIETSFNNARHSHKLTLILSVISVFFWSMVFFVICKIMEKKKINEKR